MKAPDFWQHPGDWRSLLLAPFAAIYGAVTARRMARAGARASVPVICVGNFTLGGAGKTPTAIALAGLLRATGRHPVFLTRGYGGSHPGPLWVDPATHTPIEVGDEPLLLARAAPTIMARDRVAGASRACERGGDILVMDDGFQNPALHKDIRLVVVDADSGVGNGHVFPAGPLRAPLAAQIRHADALIVIGRGAAAEPIIHLAQHHAVPVFAARLEAEATAAQDIAGRDVLAYCGIANPEKFHRSLLALPARVKKLQAFPDHHPFSPAEAIDLLTAAAEAGLDLVTTEKDFARLTGDPSLMQLAEGSLVLPVKLNFVDATALSGLIEQKLIGY